MKTTIIFLGLAALSFTNGNAANELNAQDLVQQDLATVSVDNAQKQSQLTLVKNEMSQFTIDNTGEEVVIFNPASVIQSNYTKSVEEVIAENILITETCEEAYQPIVLEMSLEDKIAESNQIIESNVTTEYFPLDFEKINRLLKGNKACNNNMAVTIDLKL
ncbi:hypothetical protein HKT18_10735 [Flavobacterium sp. IMCC34852]|uniref:Uncharacterized protein n=1 Tax=Flavobacterium rivulicola TaxID=2732161 RepID=A0A7Y3VZN8_9FLAO|nr:hypothetical protein [Flavobacterium sp. IMCC34852]NNT72691.1 hypothetical protein [Flavobacterium sp. IMCC34852]